MSIAIETRSMPTLLEQRNNLMTELEGIIENIKNETRSLNETETARYNQIKTEIGNIDSTLKIEREAEELRSKEMKPLTKGEKKDEAEQRALVNSKFEKFIRGEERALDVGNNGAIIPQEIADRIITRVRELSPILQRATVFNIGGDLIFPKFDVTSITAGYIADMTALTPQNGSFTTLKLQNFIAGSLVQVSRSLMNRQDFDLTGYVTNWMSQSFAAFIERELLVGAGTTAATGVFTDSNVTHVTATGTTSVTLDDLIQTQITVPQALDDGDLCWIMHKDLVASLRKMKDGMGYPLLNNDITSPFGWTLLGKPVFISQNAPNTMTTGQPVLVYGDMDGLYVKFAQQIELQVLNELYATSHATGIVGYTEFDARVVEEQKIVRLALA
jgi:HK97 family phage major capsid protein